jgi:glucosamine 6-phosphate synthetase-like amidotransferase/phosphosugar isomerase protein
MCKIAICYKRPFTKKEFDKAWFLNSDGVGFSYVKNNKVHIYKGLMNKNKAWEKYQEVNPPIPHIIHFRKSSTGQTTDYLTHPFLCTEKSEPFLEYHGLDSALFHNGVITGWKDILLSYWLSIGIVEDGDWSDTRLVASILSKFINDEKQIERLITKIWPSERFAIISTKGIKLIGQYSEVDDVYHSDMAYASCEDY